MDLQPHPIARSRRRSEGFTLIELLIVITIIGILSSMLFVLFGIAQRHADRTRNDSLLQKVHAGLLDYKGVFGDFPHSPADPLMGNDLGKWLCTPAASVTVGSGTSDVLSDVIAGERVVGDDIVDAHAHRRPLLYAFDREDPANPGEYIRRDTTALPGELNSDATDWSQTAYEGYEDAFELWTRGPDGEAGLLRDAEVNEDNRSVTQPFGAMSVL